MVCQATCPNCQASTCPMLPHPVFQVAGHACVERSLGFVGHDVDRRLFHDGCTVMDSRLRGNDGGGLRRRESIEYDTSFVGWAKRSVTNNLKKRVCVAGVPYSGYKQSPHFFKTLPVYVF